MSTRQYIGARYVPKFFDRNNSAEWVSGVAYEALTIVTRLGNSYTSKIPVPTNIGAPESNPRYWVATGNYNEQLQEYIEMASRGAKQYGTISDITESLPLGSIILSGGYNSANDGGGAIYIIGSTENADSIKLPSNQYATIINDVIYPEMFGAIGDGVTDDTVAIRKWLNCDHEALMMKNHTYLVTEYIEFSKSHTIYGNNGTIKVSERVNVNDIFLIKAKNINGLTIKDLTMELICSSKSPFVDDNVANHDGILFSPSNCDNVTICNSRFIVKDNGVTVPCTPIWVRQTCNNVTIKDCYIENSGNAYRSGGVWFYGTIKNARVENCAVIGSTLDEVVVTWGDDSNDLTVSDCYIKSTKKNDVILNGKSGTTLINNCVIEFNPDAINYRAIRCDSKMYVNGCTIHYGTIRESFLFSVSNSGELYITNNTIYLNITSNENGGLIHSGKGSIYCTDNVVIDVGTNRPVLWMSNDSTFNLVFDKNDVSINHSGTNGFISNFNKLSMCGNIYHSDWDISNYASTSITSKERSIYNNVYPKGSSSDIANMNAGLRNPTIVSQEFSTRRLVKDSPYDFVLPDKKSDDKWQIGIVLLKNELGHVDIGTIAQNTSHNFVYTPISAHSELNVSIVNGKLHVDYTSIYAKYFTVTIIRVDGTNPFM